MGGGALSLVAVPPDVLAGDDASARARPVLVALDASATDPDEAEGVFDIRSRRFFTHERFNRYGDEEVPTLTESLSSIGFVEHRILALKYCDVLGIDYSDMLVCAMSATWEATLQSETDAAFDALPSDMRLPDRIWAAHLPCFVKAYGGHGPGGDDVMKFIHDRYFPDVPWECEPHARHFADLGVAQDTVPTAFSPAGRDSRIR
jgi:hypothetical protein